MLTSRKLISKVIAQEFPFSFNDGLLDLTMQVIARFHIGQPAKPPTPEEKAFKFFQTHLQSMGFDGSYLKPNVRYVGLEDKETVLVIHDPHNPFVDNLTG